MNNWFKRNGIHFAIIAIFFGICFFYLTPSFQAKTFAQNDVTRAQSTQKEIMDYRAKDTTILWTNQVLGGMPTFQLWASYPYNVTTEIFRYIKAVFPDPAGASTMNDVHGSSAASRCAASFVILRPLLARPAPHSPGTMASRRNSHTRP